METISDEKIFSIQLKGALDGASSEDLLSYIEAQLNEGYTRFLFNFNFVQFITSNGISTLLRIQKRMKENSHLSFVFYGLSEEVENVLTLLGIYKKLPIKKTLQEAEKYLRQVIPGPKEEIRDEKPLPLSKPAAERIRFYYTGTPKEPVSKLEKLPTVEKEPTQVPDIASQSSGFVTPEIPAMEKLLEDKLSSLRKEIKDTLSAELEKRFTPNVRSVISGVADLPTANIPSYIQAKSKKNPEEIFTKIFPCEACGTKLRVKQIGRHQCPNCKTEVVVGSSGPARFIEKLNI